VNECKPLPSYRLSMMATALSMMMRFTARSRRGMKAVPRASQEFPFQLNRQRLQGGRLSGVKLGQHYRQTLGAACAERRTKSGYEKPVALDVLMFFHLRVLC
jgi:hypothetical protein